MSRSWSKRKIGVKSCIGFQATRMFHGRQETTCKYKHGNSELCPLQPRYIIASEQTFCPVLVPISSNSPFCKIPWRFGIQASSFSNLKAIPGAQPWCHCLFLPLSPQWILYHQSISYHQDLAVMFVDREEGRRWNLPPWQQAFAKMALAPPNIRPL